MDSATRHRHRAARFEIGHAHISGVGDEGVVYTIQASPDLVTWSDIGSALAGEGGVFEFGDPDSADLGSRFYRVTLP